MKSISNLYEISLERVWMCECVCDCVYVFVCVFQIYLTDLVNVKTKSSLQEVICVFCVSNWN